MSIQVISPYLGKKIEHPLDVSNRLNEISLMTAAEEITNQDRRNKALSNITLEIQIANFFLKQEIVKLKNRHSSQYEQLRSTGATRRENQRVQEEQLIKAQEENKIFRATIISLQESLKKEKESCAKLREELTQKNNTRTLNEQLLNSKLKQLENKVHRILADSRTTEYETNRAKKEAEVARDMAIADYQILRITLPNVQAKLNSAYQEIANLKEKNAKLYEQSRRENTHSSVSLCRPNNESHTSLSSNEPR